MDVVKTNIGRINGIIDVNSEVGQGTQIALKIPLTLAIIRVLMVKVDGEIYALPGLHIRDLQGFKEQYKV